MAEVKGRQDEIDTWRKETWTRRDGESSAPCHSAGFIVGLFWSFSSLSRVAEGVGKVKHDLAGPSTTNGGFYLPAKPPCCYMCLKRRSGNALFSVLFIASALAAAHASFMPQRSNRAIKEKKHVWARKEKRKKKTMDGKGRKKHVSETNSAIFFN